MYGLIFPEASYPATRDILVVSDMCYKGSGERGAL
jgi:hypothetical protein